MIPALLALPAVEGVVGQVLGLLSPESSTSPSSTAPTPSFTPAFNKASTATVTPAPSTLIGPSGAMTSQSWSQMNPTDLQTWMNGLTGHHVHATDISGRTISGVVEAVQTSNGVPSLNVGGHLVSLSQLNQITWSPAIR
jgi:hypothetical protein